MQRSFKTTSFLSKKPFSGVLLVALGAVLILTGCSKVEEQFTYDRSAGLSRDDYRDILTPDKIQDFGFEDNNIPEPQPYVATPEEFEEPMPLVSISVNQTVPLRDLIFELAEQAGFDVELDPQIQGSIIFTARNRPFDEVIDRISDLAGLRYKLEDGLLRVQLDRPYHETYQLDYVNLVRSLDSNISLDVSVASGGEASAGSGAAISSTNETDFWAELTSNIEQILTSSDNFVTMSTATDPQIEPTPGAAQGQQYDNNGNPIAGGQAGNVAPPVLNVQFPSAPAEPPLPNAPATFSINRQSGDLSVYATHRQHEELADYLARVKRSVTSQVLIEAKILEVSLTDEYAAGIDWSEVSKGILDPLDITFARQTLSPSVVTGNGFTGTIDPRGELSVIVDAISRFGTVRALSSPRLTVLNHQPAVLNVIQNRVFFEFDVEIERAEEVGDDDTIEVDTEIRSVPEGVVIAVLPAINPETGEITLALRPTVSAVTDTVEDPTPRLTALVSGLPAASLDALDGLTNLILQLSVQEIDSIVQMDSGEVLVMGGLMRDNNSIEQEGVPILADMPYVGNLFRNTVDRVSKTELVIFLRATLIPGSNVHPKDRELYQKFGRDRRPMDF